MTATTAMPGGKRAAQAPDFTRRPGKAAAAVAAAVLEWAQAEIARAEA